MNDYAKKLVHQVFVKETGVTFPTSRVGVLRNNEWANIVIFTYDAMCQNLKISPQIDGVMNDTESQWIQIPGEFLAIPAENIEECIEDDEHIACKLYTEISGAIVSGAVLKTADPNESEEVMEMLEQMSVTYPTSEDVIPEGVKILLTYNNGTCTMPSQIEDAVYTPNAITITTKETSKKPKSKIVVLSRANKLIMIQKVNKASFIMKELNMESKPDIEVCNWLIDTVACFQHAAVIDVKRFAHLVKTGSALPGYMKLFIEHSPK